MAPWSQLHARLSWLHCRPFQHLTFCSSHHPFWGEFYFPVFPAFPAYWTATFHAAAVSWTATGRWRRGHVEDIAAVSGGWGVAIDIAGVDWTLQYCGGFVDVCVFSGFVHYQGGPV